MYDKELVLDIKNDLFPLQTTIKKMIADLNQNGSYDAAFLVATLLKILTKNPTENLDWIDLVHLGHNGLTLPYLRTILRHSGHYPHFFDGKFGSIGKTYYLCGENLYFLVMAIAISDTNLKEIYNLSTEEKLDLVDLIIKSIRSATYRINLRTDNANVSWVDQFNGKWIDSKSADEMVADLRRSRSPEGQVHWTPQ